MATDGCAKPTVNGATKSDGWTVMLPRAGESLVGAEQNQPRMLLSGKTMAFSHFIEQNAPRVCSAVRAILGNQDEADKIAQQVFVTAWFTAKGRDTWRLPYAWIYRIVVSECYGYLRMKRLEPSVDGTLDRVHQQRDLLNQALERVPDEDRYLLLLRELEGYSVTQLSEATKLDESTIKKRLFEARQRLARNLTRNLRP